MGKCEIFIRITQNFVLKEPLNVNWERDEMDRDNDAEEQYKL